MSSVTVEYLQKQQAELEKARQQLEEEKAGFAADMEARWRAVRACRGNEEVRKKIHALQTNFASTVSANPSVPSPAAVARVQKLLEEKGYGPGTSKEEPSAPSAKTKRRKQAGVL